MPDGRFDNSYLIDSLSKVAREVDRQGKQNYIFIINSTVTPGSCDNVFMPMLSTTLKSRQFGLIYKPEFIALGTVVRDLQEPDVILIGASDAQSMQLVKHLYSRVVVRGQFHTMNLKSAELAKISLNCFVTMKISFANQIGMIADEIGADSRAVLEAVGADARVGNKNLIPGLPFGGPCFPRDNRMMSAISRGAALSVATDSINYKVKSRILGSVTYSHVDGPIGILGTAYKPGTRVTEESLGVWLYEQLRRAGFEVWTYDPAAPCSHSLDDVLGCSVIVIACPHKEFKSILFGREQQIIDPAKIANPARVQHLNKAVVTTCHGANANSRS
jgi:UDPglucose 6-dehydrogenase